MKPAAFAITVVAQALLSTTLAATQLRDGAQTLLDAAPDQETLHEVLTPAPDKDADDRAEAATERDTKMIALRKEYDESAGKTKLARPLYELAMLQQDRAFQLRDEAIERYLTELDKWLIHESLLAPELDLAAHRGELLKRVAVLREVLGNFPNDLRRDELNWHLSNTLARVGNDQCEPYFKQAIMHSKTPEWITKAKLSRADYLVGKDKVDEALAIYTEVRQTALEPIKSYATYRLGWVHLVKGLKAQARARQDAFDKAKAALKLVVIGLEDYDDESRFPLRSEAGSDLAWIWALEGNEKEPAAFFEKHDLKDKLTLFRDKLAHEWLSQGKADKAIAFYHELALKNPEDPRIPDYILAIAQYHIGTGNIAAMKAETDMLQRITTNKEDPWFDEHEDDAKLMTQARTILKQLPLTIGFTLFRIAADEKDPRRKKDMLEGAARELRAQVKTATNRAEGLEIQLTLISALLQLEKYREAPDQLDDVISLGSSVGARLESAVTDRLNVLVKLDEQEKYPPVPAAGTVKSPMELPPLKKRFAAAAADYLRLIKDSEIEPNLRYQLAQDLYAYGRYEEAMQAFEKIIVSFPKTEQSRASIELLMSYRLKKENWDELIRLGSAFLKNSEIKEKDVRDYLKQNVQYAKEKKKEAG